MTGDTALVVREGEALEAWLELSTDQKNLLVRFAPESVSGQAGGGERLSSREVSALPLNRRDFGQLLLLAAGTMTDINGAANFTQQFAVNGQRGTTAVFSMDGVDASDPQLGGATFANYNIDAIQEIRSNSGVMPAEIGHGAAASTDVITKSGTSEVHGTVFEFIRNAALDARNFFDRRTPVNPGRLPPFARNEFGFTNGGPVLIPGLYDGRKRTYYFGQYQGFRQVLGTTQVFPVPTVEERQGIDRTAFPGDALNVPVNPVIASVLARFPLPNDPQGPYGSRTFATSSKVLTTTNQFSLRLDHHPSERGRITARFNYNNVNGPTVNPSQTVIDPSFGIRFLDRQRNLGITYTRTSRPNLTWHVSLGVLRTTPFFRTFNRTQPALIFGDVLYEPFNVAAGAVVGSFGNLFEVRHDLTYVRGKHTFKMGADVRFDRDTKIAVFGPNGAYIFGSGTAYAQAPVPSASGRHDIRVGDALPDALTGFLTATPYAFTASVAAPGFAQGDHAGESAVRRGAYNFYFQDTWKASPRFTLAYGLRYELNGRIREAKRRYASLRIVGPEGRPARVWDPGARTELLLYPNPPYALDRSGWGPRMSLEWRASTHTVLRAGAGLTTILPNLFSSDFLTGGIPFVYNPYVTALAGVPVPFQNAVTVFNLPPVYTPQGQVVFATGRTTDVAPNTQIDIARFESDLAAVTPGHQVQPLLGFGMPPDFRNGTIATYRAGVEHEFADVSLSLAYVGTAGIKLASIIFPNGYGGAERAFAPFARFDASGNVVGGFGPIFLLSNRSHSSYHALQVSAVKTSTRAGVGFQASYTLSKALDDTSNVFGGFGAGASSTTLQSFPQDPRNPGAEKGPSTFDLRQILVLSVIQALPFDRWGFFRPLGPRLTSGWQLLNISTITSGLPFSVFSGVQQTGAGSFSTDRPDLVGQPSLSTNRKVREDYFGQGESNSAFFFIPTGVPGGSGPNRGRFGRLGRNTFRGPMYHNFDVALIKDTPFGRRGANEAATLEFRAEFFNIFNLVNFGLPSNIVRGTGFGLISRTAGPSRQVQFSLKLFY